MTPNDNGQNIRPLTQAQNPPLQENIFLANHQMNNLNGGLPPLPPQQPIQQDVYPSAHQKYQIPPIAYIDQEGIRNRQARYTNQDYPPGGVDLRRQSQGQALAWFRLDSSVLANYPNFVTALLRHYTASDRQGRLLEQARNRYQTKNENVNTFVTAMRSIFDQLDISIPIESQLSNVNKNLHQDYMKDIFRNQFHSYNELMELGKQIEHRLDLLWQNRPAQNNKTNKERTASIDDKNTPKSDKQTKNSKKKNNVTNNKSVKENKKKLSHAKARETRKLST